MTERQIYLAIHNIEVRNYNDFALNAKLKGAKIALKNYNYYKVDDRSSKGKNVNPEFSEDERAAADKAMLQALVRKGMRQHRKRR